MTTTLRAEEIRSRYRALRNVSVNEIVSAKETERRARLVLCFLVAVIVIAVGWAVVKGF